MAVDQLFHDLVGGLLVEAGQGDMGAVDLLHDGVRLLQRAIAIQPALGLVCPVVGQQIVDQVHVGQRDVGIGLYLFTVVVNGLAVVAHVPVPDGMAFGLAQDPLAVLFSRRAGDRLLGVAGRPLCVGVAAVPVEIGDQLGGPRFVLALQLVLQEILKLPEHVRRKLLLRVHAVFNAVEALLRGQIEEIVDGDAEDFRQQGQSRDVGHRHRVFPLGHRLRADPQLFRQLLLCHARLEAKLFDFLSQFHIEILLQVVCFLLAGSLYETGSRNSITQISSPLACWLS